MVLGGGVQRHPSHRDQEGLRPVHIVAAAWVLVLVLVVMVVVVMAVATVVAGVLFCMLFVPVFLGAGAAGELRATPRCCCLPSRKALHIQQEGLRTSHHARCRMRCLHGT